MNLWMNSKGKCVRLSVAGLLVGCLVVSLSLGAAPARGQATSTGTVQGVVTDQQDASVAGAEVKLIDRTTNVPKSTSTNDVGRYIFVNISPGLYDLTVSKTGFKLSKVSQQAVDIGTVLTLNVKLEVGSTVVTVEVTASVGGGLQTSNSTIGTTLGGPSLLLLPNPGRDVTSLLIAQPGVLPGGYSAGANYDQNLFQLDGGQNSNDMDGSMSIYTPSSGNINPNATGGPPSGVLPTPVESIEEFKVSTANQTADFNGAGGAQVQLATKRGTDSWHGEASEYYLGSYFGANSWNRDFLGGAAVGLGKVATHQNRFGAAGGGPVIPFHFLGGKWYIFADYEGLRYPLSQSIEKDVPSALFREGIIQIKGPSGTELFNMSSAPITVGATTYPSAGCGPTNSTPCDPRGLWFNPTISGIWSKYMPLPNDPSGGDQLNVQGYLGTVVTPVSSDFGVARIDHDFSSKWHFMTSYRDYDFSNVSTVQTDVGGFFPGDTKGTYAAIANRPIKPMFIVAGLTGSLTPNLTNDFHVSYLRNFWSWSDQTAPPQVAGIPGAIEISPASTTAETANALIPYNVNTQSVRERFWDGQDWYYKDDLTLSHGNHVFQFGGLFQHNFNYHTRDDNGSGTFNNPVFLVSSGDSGVTIGSAFQPMPCTASVVTNCLPTNQVSKWQSTYDELLGITGAQVAYTRSGPNLTLQPLGSTAFDKSIIDTYNLYFSDTWRLTPTFTLNYGLGYLVETPPFETSGKQISVVDSSNNPIDLTSYLATRQRMALAGQIFNPPIGYELVGNIGGGQKYPYHFFWGGLSPRASAAWNPHFDNGILSHLFGSNKTVLRGGYSRIYGRQNGVDLVLVPLLGVGLIQAVKCPGARMDGVCAGLGGTDPTNAFRIGIDPNPGALYTQGITNTLPQPFFPGEVNAGSSTPAAKASDTLVLDPNFKPAHSDEFNFTIQRELAHNTVLEVGYIGRILRNEYMNINLDQIPWMLTLGGQSFENAYANVYKSLCGLTTPVCVGNAPTSVPVQPFLEAALGGAASPYCAAFSSCTVAFATNENSNIASQSLYTMWSHLGKTAPGTPFAGSLIGQAQATSLQMSGAFGQGDYNAGFVSLSQRNWHGVTLNSNFTWSRSLGTQFYAQANNGINPNDGYDPTNHGSFGPQPYDITFVFNLQGLYQIPIYKNQSGFVGHILGGWAVAPFFTWHSGTPELVYTDGNISDETFGQGNPASGSLGTNAILLSPFTAGSSRINGINVATTASANPDSVATNGNIANGGTGINMFANPIAVYNQFRPYILGLDNVNGVSGGGGGILRGQSRWQLDMTISKDIKFSDRFGLSIISTFTNILNHPWLPDPYLDLQDPQDFGVIPNGQANAPRQIEFGARIRF